VALSALTICQRTEDIAILRYVAATDPFEAQPTWRYLEETLPPAVMESMTMAQFRKQRIFPLRVQAAAAIRRIEQQSK
jgi:hypothetical protein